MPAIKASRSAAESEAIGTLLAGCKVMDGRGFRLADHPTRAALPSGLSKDSAESLIAAGVSRLSDLQELLYANATWSVLVVIQAMDAAGKDGTIKHVMSGVNPQGVHVTAFKPPGPDDLAHDFLWRVSRALPARGMIGIFNRSHYEEVLVPRVHPDVLARQRLPAGLGDTPAFWEGRLADIAAFERHLAREGTLVLKFFLHVGREEQKKRFLARLNEPGKMWKFDPGDLAERGWWADYARAYEAAIKATAGEYAPWFVIPADQKWLMRLLVVEAINGAIGTLGLAPVAPTPEQIALFGTARAALEAEP